MKKADRVFSELAEARATAPKETLTVTMISLPYLLLL